MRGGGVALALLLAACSSKSSEPAGNAPKAAAPEPLPRLTPAPGDGGVTEEDREALFRVKPAPVYGRKVPKDALRLELTGTKVKLADATLDLDRPGDVAALAAKLDKRPVLLVPDADVFLAQVAPLLALLDDKGVETWLLHPSREVAYPLTLRDEPAFQEWLAEPKPGKVRIIQRADGYELSTNVGKLPGADPNGPSVPVRGGQLDIATLRRGLTLLKGRFKKAEDSCIVPTFGTELQKVAQSLSGYFQAPDEPIFDELCLVYPRPRAKDGG